MCMIISSLPYIIAVGLAVIIHVYLFSAGYSQRLRLQQAVREGNIGQIQTLLDQGENINDLASTGICIDDTFCVKFGK